MFTKSKTEAKKGFTLIELLVVVSIIGLLSTLAVVALNNARIRSRDAKRLSDMDAVSTAMQLYFDANGSYTGACKNSSGTAIATFPAALSSCVGNSSTTGIDDYIPNMAALADPTGTTACANPASAVCNYAFNAIGATTFTVNFWEEDSSFAAGTVTEVGLIK